MQSISSMRHAHTKVLSMATLNKNLVRADYAVRGEIAVRAEQLRAQLQAGPPGSLPFREIVNCNIGNPQQLGQQPITFFRQVASLVEYADLLADKNEQLTRQLFPADAIARAKRLVRDCGGNIGAYSHSQGIAAVRESVAAFIKERDGYPADANNIFLTAGASQGVQYILQAVTQHERVGVMIPIPQYPLYTAGLALNNGTAVPYYLDEESGWSLSIAELERSLTAARQAGTDVRALCVINPGNPTGNTLSADNIKAIIKFCVRERLVLLADEVYQTNIYMPESRPFVSFKRALMDMADSDGAIKDGAELISFHSISKGVVGECGRRGGYFECVGIDADVRDQLYKLASIALCPTVQGQIMVDLMVNPPRQGDESYPLYRREVDGIYESLKRRSIRLVEAFNALEGVSCQPAEGAMYVFPSVKLPQRAIDEAKLIKKEPDAFYVMELLNATGVCMVPGSGFGQKAGTFHFRSTFLPPESQLEDFISRIAAFHGSFMNKYR